MVSPKKEKRMHSKKHDPNKRKGREKRVAMFKRRRRIK